ncbi:MAG: hypothetical protein Ct9H300mP11_25920 [Chloroflexota bacterium]|nr:MAG: hypothetical protein Ct9H300mP11_25920 [Chloroflexota bacterium]
MEFTEAVTRSAQTGQTVALPLKLESQSAFKLTERTLTFSDYIRTRPFFFEPVKKNPRMSAG